METPAAPVVGRILLRLFVAGATVRSRLAILSVRQLCAAEPLVRCKLEVIDIFQQPDLARAYQIIATPTLLREFPFPARRYIGDLAHLTGLFAVQAAPNRDRRH